MTGKSTIKYHDCPLLECLSRKPKSQKGPLYMWMLMVQFLIQSTFSDQLTAMYTQHFSSQTLNLHTSLAQYVSHLIIISPSWQLFFSRAISHRIISVGLLEIMYFVQEQTIPSITQDSTQSVSPTILLLMSHSFLAAWSSVAMGISSSSSQLAKHFPDTPSTSGEQVR